MAPSFSDIVEEARLSARALLDYGDSFFNPTVRLGVTGLSRAGKTVFITALIHGLTRGGRFPIFEPYATGRIARARLEPQPDDAVPRFAYENHVRTLIEERRWPSSTVDISELRLVIDYQRQNGADRTLTIDIVDYPASGCWICRCSTRVLSNGRRRASRCRARARAQNSPHHGMSISRRFNPKAARTNRRRSPRQTVHGLFARLPRRTLCDEPAAARPFPDAGQSRGSPALTFAPLEVRIDGSAPDGSLWAMMRRRYEAYKDVVVRPFFRDHFARLDRQIVLVDALAAFNAGRKRCTISKPR
jgi:predicted YcjX-like family ATPase